MTVVFPAKSAKPEEFFVVRHGTTDEQGERIRGPTRARLRASAMPLAFLPDVESLLLWGDDAQLAELRSAGTPHAAALLTPEGVRQVEGARLPLLDSAAKLAAISSDALAELSPSVAIWALASKLGLELVARERVVPKLARRHGRMEARWAAALSAAEDSSRVAALARSMPPAAHAVPIDGAGDGKAAEVWAPDALLRAYLDALVDALLRSSQGAPELGKTPAKARKSGKT